MNKPPNLEEVAALCEKNAAAIDNLSEKIKAQTANIEKMMEADKKRS